MTYLRMTVIHWSIDLDSPEGKKIFSKIQVEEISVFHKQLGFYPVPSYAGRHPDHYRSCGMGIGGTGKTGCKELPGLVKESGIATKLILEQLNGKVVVSFGA
jgi:hypothetical protein